MNNVFGIYNSQVVSMIPNPLLIENIQALLKLAESGQLQSLVGTGFTVDGLRVATWSDFHPNIYEMHGALAWLQVEYVERHPAESE